VIFFSVMFFLLFFLLLNAEKNGRTFSKECWPCRFLFHDLKNKIKKPAEFENKKRKKRLRPVTFHSCVSSFTPLTFSFGWGVVSFQKQKNKKVICPEGENLNYTAPRR
jgi:hypothetical protein